jgi:hypothetical protein
MQVGCKPFVADDNG